jgi:tRNA (guanine10-N2)-methyltransferase
LLLQGIFDVWGEGNSFEEMMQSVASHPAHCKAPYLQRDASFKIIMSTVGFKWIGEQNKHYVHEVVERLGFEGDVELDNPQNTFWVVTVDSDGEAGMQAMPTRWVFGRQVALGDRCVVMTCLCGSHDCVRLYLTRLTVLALAKSPHVP